MSKLMPEIMKKAEVIGGVKWFISQNSVSSLEELIYAAPQAMQASSGETSHSAQTPQMPSRSAITKISRFSRLRPGVMTLFNR